MANCPRPLKDAVAAYNAYNAAGLACFIVGGVSFVGMVTYVVWPAPQVKPGQTKTVQGEVLPVVGPGFAGVTGTF
jgi:hypothetical protein